MKYQSEASEALRAFAAGACLLSLLVVGCSRPRERSEEIATVRGAVITINGAIETDPIGLLNYTLTLTPSPPAGWILRYTFTFIDHPELDIGCEPPPGSVIPPGSTVLECLVRDNMGGARRLSLGITAPDFRAAGESCTTPDVCESGLCVAGVCSAPGGSCTTGAECSSGFCEDSVCCAAACGGSDPNDCQACSAAAGSSADGTCSLLGSVVCRPGAGPCDVPESCTGSSAACPGDAFAPGDTVCHPTVGACDVAEFCPGDAPDCPADDLLASGTTCYTRPSLCVSVEETLACSGGPFCPIPTPWDAGDCSATPSGIDVTVDLNGGSGADDGVTLTFDGVTSEGETALVSQGTGCPPPTGFQVLRTGQLPSSGAYWDIETTATTSGTIRICLHYDQGTMAEGGALEQSLRIVHGSSATCDGSGWTTLLNLTRDMANNVICGDTTSLSPFAIVAPILFGVPNAVVAYATSTAGAVVTYPTPEALYFVDGQIPATCTPASGATFPVGQTTVNCTAADASGNPSEASFTVWVQYQAPGDGSFFLQPINADGSSLFRRGSTIPVKFKLQGASAGITDLVAHLSVAKVSNGVSGTFVEAISTAACDGGDTFRYSGGQYVFNLSTRAMSTGSWVLRADLGDGVDHTVTVSLK